MQKHRCQWCGEDPLYVRYHDEEWGLPTYDDATLFEFLILEGAQAGLAWITVLKKREGYRAVFDQFDPNKIARFSDAKLDALKLDERIIRNRLKINSARQNARAFLSVQAEWGSFSQYLWHFVDGKPVINQVRSLADVPAKTPLSDHALYITVNNIVLNSGTEHEQEYPLSSSGRLISSCITSFVATAGTSASAFLML